MSHEEEDHDNDIENEVTKYNELFSSKIISNNKNSLIIILKLNLKTTRIKQSIV